MESTSASSVSMVRNCSTSRTTCFSVDIPPVGSWMGSEPGGVLTPSAAAPGQTKPLGGQARGTALPVGLQKPGCTGKHPLSDSRPVRLDDVPPGHGSSADAPSGQYVPPLQYVHAVAPLCGWNMPPIHWMHRPVRAVGALLPGRHSCGCVLPPGHSYPAIQAMQSSALVKLPIAYVPGSHVAGNGTLLPMGHV